ncbi:unnamed protein product [Calypogeia fissa]
MATFIRKLFGHFGAKKDHAHRKPEVRSEEGGRCGVRVSVAAETAIHVPVVSRSAYGNGGVQGLTWYTEKLRVDDDGDVAQEFLSEATPECVDADHQGTPPRLESVVQTKPAILKGPVCTQNGNVHQDVERPSEHLWT